MDFWLHVLNSALIFVILGLGANLLIGYTGLITLAAGAQFGIGAYTAALLIIRLEAPFPVAVLGAMAFTAVLSGVSAWPALRVRGEYLILLTLALQMMLEGVFGAWRDVTGGSSGLVGITRPVIGGEKLIDPDQWLPLIAIVAAVAFLVAWRIGGSPFGRMLRGIRENESAAVALGKRVTTAKTRVFALSGLFAGLAGALFAPYQAFINPASFSLNQSVFVVAFLVLGGSANLIGTVVGALVLVGIPEILRFLDVGMGIAEPVRELIYGVLLVAFMLFRPQGLLPEGLWSGRSRRGVRAASPGAAASAASAEPATAPASAAGSAEPARSAKSTGSAGSSAPGSGTGPAAPAVPAGERRHAPGEVLLRATGVTKAFGGIAAATDLNVELRSGRVTALVGPNGAGKTTLFNLVTGFVTPDRGTVELLGRDVTRLAPAQRVERGLARTFQDVRLFTHLTALENVQSAVPRQPGESLLRLFLSPARVARAERAATERALECLRFVGLDDKADIPVGRLAFGEQKLVSIARLMATGADVLLLDEPASGVDRAWVERILPLITELAAQGKTVCIVEHNLDVVRAVAEHAYFMNAGRIIAEGTPEELMNDPELSVIYFGSRDAGVRVTETVEGS
jgi:branched-chain amino acid transport system permease protein